MLAVWELKTDRFFQQHKKQASFYSWEGTGNTEEGL